MSGAGSSAPLPKALKRVMCWLVWNALRDPTVIPSINGVHVVC